METGRYYLDRDRIVDFGLRDNPFTGNEVPLRTFGLVEIRAGPVGTKIIWDVDEVSPESLLSAIDRLPFLPPPFILRYFKLAWFSECLESHDDAIARLTNCMTFSGIPLLRSALTRHIDTRAAQELARDFAHRPDRHSAQVSYSAVDHCRQTLPVVEAGCESMIAKLFSLDGRNDPDWRIHTANQKLETGVINDYDRILTSGKAQMDHVIASIHPQGSSEPEWFAYRRLAAPIRHEESGEHCVAALCIPSRVDFDLMGWSG